MAFPPTFFSHFLKRNLIAFPSATTSSAPPPSSPCFVSLFPLQTLSLSELSLSISRRFSLSPYSSSRRIPLSAPSPNTLPPPCSRAPLRGPPARQVGLDAIASWQVVCNITRLKAKASRCCVSFSAFYNDSVVPCGCPDGLSCDTDAAPLLLPPKAWAKIKRTTFDNRTAKAKAWVQRGLQHPALLAVDQELESQANATVFLTKFYSRAGLMNLINAGPNHLRPGLYQ
ncbi:hypothetical protein Taro_010106 [Colocasia esculenta]|uniref:COBRA C-terminal domain-containing protein n=1 Tax=Colocasia esculenta TaxID=4460 RepID=A0A843TY13_COLES|nr:hypothetical protein [Colocasia esculenta]